MKGRIALVALVFVLLWLIAIGLFSGWLPNAWLPEALQLDHPASYALLGEAMGTLDGLFGSIAIVLGLVAILFQGQELKAATQAQTIQTQALAKQIAQQDAANLLGAYSARLSYLTSEIELMTVQIDDLLARNEKLEARPNPDHDKIAENWEWIKKIRQKQKRYRKDRDDLDDKIKNMLGNV